MHRLLLLFILLMASLTLSCGSSNNRRLQSITIHTVTNGPQIQFTATGTFSAPPTTVSPLPVFWASAPPPPQYTLTTQPYVYSCANMTAVVPGPLIAFAPADPNAPSSGAMSGTKMISASTAITCQ